MRGQRAHFASPTEPSANLILNVAGGQFSAGNEAGEDSYTVTLGGKSVPVTRNGQPSGTVSAKQPGKNSLRLTYANDGNVTHTATLKLASNDQSLEMITHDPRTGATTTMVHHKT